MIKTEFDKNKILKYDYILWRYKNFLSFIAFNEIVSLGEGWTPIVKFKKNLYFKLDFLNPTGSFKDRGSSVLISALHKKVKQCNAFISEDSSGNAGASIAAYAARVNLKTEIYVPASVSGNKINQILFYGAYVKRIRGSRSKVAFEAQKSKDKRIYVGHIWHPLFRDGMRSLSYELAEQFKYDLPDRIYIPVSAGTLLLGVIQGLEDLLNSGTIKNLPTVIACQTEQVSPLYHKLKRIPYIPPKKITSIADALVSVNPPLLEFMLEKMSTIKSEIEIVNENQIYNAFIELGKNGFFVEPGSATAYAVYKKQGDSQKSMKNKKSVILLTGTGLKTKLTPSARIIRGKDFHKINIFN
jgi:threonine synthase